MSEQRFRRRILDLLEPLGAFPVENTAGDGAPDVATTLGWIELKYAHGWPIRPGSLVDLGLRNSQRIWLTRWGRVGGRAWVLAKIGQAGASTTLLWRGPWASANIDRVDRLALERNAVAVWSGTLSSEALIGAIVRDIRETRT